MENFSLDRLSSLDIAATIVVMWIAVTNMTIMIAGADVGCLSSAVVLRMDHRNQL